MKVAIVGSRDFDDYKYLFKVMHHLNSNGNITEVVCGCARGADSLGELWAKQNGIKVTYFKPDWSKGKGAGFDRNKEMAHYCDAVVAFWDGKSRGTKQMIEYSKSLGKRVIIKQY